MYVDVAKVAKHKLCAVDISAPALGAEQKRRTRALLARMRFYELWTVIIYITN